MNILITGASRGIGYATALELAQNGHQVMALSRNAEGLAHLAAAAVRPVRVLSFDLEQPDWPGLQDWLGDAPLHVVINNAGLLLQGPFESLDTATWARSLSVNVTGPAQLIRHLLPQLRRANGAHVVNISSMGGVQGSSKYPGLSVYSASKGAITVLSECLAAELANDNISVNALALGAVQTEMLATAFPGYEAPLAAADMARWISWFAVEGSQFFNGQILPVALSNP